MNPGSDVITQEEMKVFEGLFRAHFQRLCHKAYVYVRDEQLAEDLVQDVFVKLWGQRRVLLDAQSREAYLYRCLINHALDHLKTTAKVRVLTMDNAPVTASTAESGEDVFIVRELNERIQKAIHELPPGCRQVFMLHRYEELNYQQIARMLNLSINSVEKHMSRALRILRQLLLSLFLILSVYD